MVSLGFETTISAGERPQTYALDRAVTETGPRDLELSEISAVDAFLLINYE